MPIPQTEMRHSSGQGFDVLAPQKALRVLTEAQVRAAQSVELAIPQIAQGAELMAQVITNGGKLIYAAAGSSGLMALADALELPGTYGIAREQIKILLAGGMAGLEAMQGGPEDDADAARADLARVGVTARDCVIAVTASGHTPYPLAIVDAARLAGAHTIGIANNVGAALFDRVEVSICLTTPPEVIAGSTRMGAGTAQKMALNMLSTMMATRLGHVHDGYMVNVVADNLKLRERAKAIVVAITGVSDEKARAAIEASDGAVKEAIVLAAGAPDRAAAARLLAAHGGILRPALMALGK